MFPDYLSVSYDYGEIWGVKIEANLGWQYHVNDLSIN